MCGIAGRFAAAALSHEPGWRLVASERLAHRGPDGAGWYADARCELVHRRLALIDLTPTGHQPMPNEDESVWVTFNGEIYNHAPLRAELARRGHAFRGTSDTEVLVHLYEEHGERLVDRLRGIFAFAIYDRRRGRVLLARDRFGIKPLFYARHEGAWIFASEMKAITALPGFAPTFDRQACYDYLGLGYVPEPATGFANIHALPRGSTLLLSADGERLERYHRTEAQVADSTCFRDMVDGAEERLLRAVAGQAVADVPVASLLSGGIDSSLVVAAHGRASAGGITAFTVGFPDPSHDESGLAGEVAGHVGTRHVTIDGGDRALTPDAVMDLMRHFDQPFADTSFIPTHWVSSAVRDQGMKCALSGDGGDETFGGYARFHRLNRIVALMRSGDIVLRTMSMGGRALAGPTRDFGRQLARAAQLARAGRDDSAPLLSGFSSYLSEEQKEALVQPAAREGLQPVARLFDGYEPRGAQDLEELSRRMTETLFAISLPSDMLRKVDMMSMKASVEVRVPLLDEDVVALGLTLPHRFKTDGRAGKLVLRGLAERWLPRSIARAPKRGFSIPLDVMVPGSLHEAMADLLGGTDARTRPFLNDTLVRQWLSAFAAARHARQGGAISREGLYRRAFMLLSLELWLRDHRLAW